MSRTKKIDHPDNLVDGQVYEISYLKWINQYRAMQYSVRIEFLALITKRGKLLVVGFDDTAKRFAIHWRAIREIEQCM